MCNNGNLTLVLMGFTDLSFDGGGAQSALPIFICENHRKSNKIVHCVEKKKLFDWQF